MLCCSAVVHVNIDNCVFFVNTDYPHVSVLCHVCNYCGVKFSSSSTLQAHLAIYCSKKPTPGTTVTPPAGLMGTTPGTTVTPPAGHVGTTGNIHAGENVDGCKSPLLSLFSIVKTFAMQRSDLVMKLTE